MKQTSIPPIEHGTPTGFRWTTGAGQSAATCGNRKSTSSNEE